MGTSTQKGTSLRSKHEESHTKGPPIFCCVSLFGLRLKEHQRGHQAVFFGGVGWGGGLPWHFMFKYATGTPGKVAKSSEWGSHCRNSSSGANFYTRNYPPASQRGSAQTPVERLFSSWKGPFCTSMLVGGRVAIRYFRLLPFKSFAQPGVPDKKRFEPIWAMGHMHRLNVGRPVAFQDTC